MKRYIFTILILTMSIVLNKGNVWGQNSENFDMLDLLRAGERAPLKPIGFIAKNVGEYSTPRFEISPTSFGSFSNDIGKLKISRTQLENQLHSLFGFDEHYTFGRLKTIEDELGFLHTNYLVYYNGYEIDGQMVMIHENKGFVTSINGIVKEVQEKTNEIAIADEKAIGIAMSHLGVTQLVDQYPVDNVLVRLRDNQQVYRFAKRVKIFSFLPLKKYNVYIDVRSGEVIKQVSLLPHADVLAQANTYYNGMQTITVDSYGDVYRLKNNARNISTYNGHTWQGTTYPTDNLLFTNTTLEWTANSLKPAVQVHWAMEKTYDYYQQVHSRNSFDNAYGNIYNIYNPIVWDNEGMACNAAAISGGIMVYGRGGAYGGTIYKPFVALDIAGHEFAHLVTDYSSGNGLKYEYESGALNESFSDIFGVSIDFFTNGERANWLIGEQVYNDGTSFMRSMQEPSTSSLLFYERQPDTYLGQYWERGDSDNGGVHTNSGVQNYWFYLLCMGGSGINDNGNAYNVEPIGIEAARNIAYRNLMFYLPNAAQYIDAYNGSINAVNDLYGADSPQYNAVRAAWYAVGVGSDNENTSSVDIATDIRLHIYPNPAKDYILIDLNGVQGNANIVISDIYGRVVEQLSYDSSVRTQQIDIQQLANGVYTLQLFNGSVNRVEKLVINR